MGKPLIGITADSESKINSRGAREERYFLKKALTDAVTLAGGLPVILPFAKSAKEARGLVDGLNGLLISGGDFDIDPKFYREKRIAKCGQANPPRTQSELLLLKAALTDGQPVLGICGGLQLINVFFGGALHQDVQTQIAGALHHSQKERHDKTSHKVSITPESLLGKITGTAGLGVNSTHHQSVKKPGKGLKVSATSPDGVVEAVEKKGGFLLGVQWHPEFLVKDDRHLAIFKAFVKASR
jgi:putative glutamine amidotransferase